MAVTRRINSDRCFFSLLCISGVCLLLIKTHCLGSSWWHYKWEEGSCSTVAKVMSVWIWKCSTYFRYQIKYFIAYDHWEHLKVTFHMSERSFSALKETLKWTGKPWAPLLTCLRAMHKMAAEANRYQSPGFCQTRRHAPRPWVLLVDTGDWRMLVMEAWLCLSVPISCRKARWLLLKWAGLGQSLLSPQCVGGTDGWVRCGTALLSPNSATWLCASMGMSQCSSGNRVWCFLRAYRYICLFTSYWL